MILPYLKRFTSTAINSYKFHKYRKYFCEPLTNEEKTLVMPFIGFLLQPGIKVVYDIGAASGEFATAIAKQRDIRSVCAFEPLPNSWSTLCKTAKFNPKICCFNTALGDKDGLAKFYVTSDGDSSSCLKPSKNQGELFPQRGLLTEINVPITTLDNFVKINKLHQPDIIIMDVQGYELHVLKGALNILSGVRYCILECCFIPLYEGAPLIDDIWSYMRSLGWRVVGVGPQHCDKLGSPIFVDLIFGRTIGANSK